MNQFESIIDDYKGIRSLDYAELASEEFSNRLEKIVEGCRLYLDGKKKFRLTSKVEGKEYFAFTDRLKHSRAICLNLFNSDWKIVESFLSALRANDFSDFSEPEINKAGYTIAIAFCAVIDLEKSRDQKTPGTFFEYFVGHCFAKRLGICPTKRLEVLNLGPATTLPTDFVFDLGVGKPKFHLPVKTSTRERVIQVWAHQRVLDGVYGVGRFWGTLVSLSETKLDHKKYEVIEICLPKQWQLYQLFIAQMKRVYYFDVPKAYQNLNQIFPKIHVKTFGEFIIESADMSNFD